MSSCYLCELKESAKEVYIDSDDVIVVGTEDSVVAMLKEHKLADSDGKASGMIKLLMLMAIKHRPNTKFAISLAEEPEHMGLIANIQ